VWEVSGMREGVAANVELDVMIEAANLPQRDEFRRITNEQGLKAAIAWRDARFRDRRA
jgi:enoyl-CoA hydratase